MAKPTQTDEEKAADEQIGKAPERPEGVPDGSVYNAETGIWEGPADEQTPTVDAGTGSTPGTQLDFAAEFAKAVASLPQGARAQGPYTPVPVIAPESIKTTTAKNGTVTAHIGDE